jgi:hypothetical protein
MTAQAAAGAGPDAATGLQCPGAEDPPRRCAILRASGTAKRGARWRPSGATRRAGGRNSGGAAW